MEKLKEKVAIITGAASGIGQASAELFAKEKAKVVVADVNDEKGKDVVNAIIRAGGQAIYVHTDVSKTADIENLVKTTVDTFGGIDIVFNNAGISIVGPIDMITEEIFEKTMRINVTGAFLLTKFALPYLLKSKGNVLFTSSVTGLDPTPGLAYGTSKAAILMLMRTFSYQFAAQGLRFNAICPGVIETPIYDGMPKDLVDWMVSTIPSKKMGKPEEVAQAALFLVSDDASYITGSHLKIDAGHILPNMH